MRLLFDHGTLVLSEAPDINLDFAPGLLWDPRVALFRARAHQYADVVDALRARRLRFDDEVVPRSVPEAGPWKPLELRPYQRAALLAWELADRRGM